MSPAAGERGDVVLVHGLWLAPTSLRPLAWRLEQQGFRTHCYGYATRRGDVYGHADALRQFIEALDVPVHIVAHSLGGLVSLRMLERAAMQQVGRLVLLGSPVRGSRAGEVLARSRFGRALLGGTGAPGGVLGPAIERWQGPQTVGLVCGSMRFGLGRLLVRHDGPNDGTVAVAETSLPGATARLVLPVSHFGLLISPDVARESGHFLHYGRFAHPAAEQASPHSP